MAQRGRAARGLGELRALADLVNLVGDESVRLAADGVGRFRVWGLHEAEDLARLLLYPVALVVDDVLSCS
jgi:hypothetical protein